MCLWIQLPGMLLVCGSQFVRAFETLEGMSLSLLLLIAAYTLLHLSLAWRADREKKNSETANNKRVYFAWLLGVGFVLFAVLKNSYQWSEHDTVTMALAFTGTIAIFGTGSAWGLPLSDARLQSMLAMVFKAIPQFILAWKIYEVGGAGMPGLAILAGNLTIIGRIIRVHNSLKSSESISERWLLRSEWANELSWLAVSVVWLKWFIF